MIQKDKYLNNRYIQQGFMSKIKISIVTFLASIILAVFTALAYKSSDACIVDKYVNHEFNVTLSDAKPEQDIDTTAFKTSEKIAKELYRRSGNAREKLIPTTNQICKKYQSCIVIVPELKNFDTATEKVKREYHGDWKKLTDIVRCSIVFSNIKDINHGLEDFNNSGFPIVYIKDRFKNPTKSGYRDINALFDDKKDRIIGEVQFHLCHIIKVKNMEHRLYEAKRDIEGDASKEHRALSPIEQKVIEKLDLISQEIYKEAYDDALKGKTCSLQTQ
jgi:hypothetical protein